MSRVDIRQNMFSSTLDHAVRPCCLFQRDLLAVQRLVWHKALVGALREGKIILASSTQKAVRLSLYPYLCLLDEKDYVDIMIQVYNPLNTISILVLGSYTHLLF